MKLRNVKTLLLKIFGETVISYIQGMRFAYLLVLNRYVDPEFGVAQALLKKGDVAVDVGANGGNWTKALYTAVGKQGNIYAFEADPYYAKATRICLKICGMGSVELFPFGLSNENETVSLNVTDSEGLRVSGVGQVDRNLEPSDKNAAPKIELKTLDSLLDPHPGLNETRLIKCDVEGFELFVFQGASKLLSANKPIIILETGNYEDQGYTSQDITNFFQNLDYQLFMMTSKNKLTLISDLTSTPTAISENRVLIHQQDWPGLKKELLSKGFEFDDAVA